MIRLLFFLPFFFLPFLYKHFCHPINPHKYQIELPFQASWEISEPAPEKILSQEFTFLGEGLQSTIFLSADQKYVLKLFKFQQCKLPLGSATLDRLRGKFNKRRSDPKAVFNAVKLSYDQLKEETGLLWIHLNPTKKALPLHIIDSFGISHKVENARFALQHRADPHLLTAIASSPERRDEVLASFAKLLTSLEEKGIASTDGKVTTNYGLLDNRVIQIDFADNVQNPELAHRRTLELPKKLLNKLMKSSRVKRFETILTS